MPAADDEAIRARFASMTHEELERVVAAEREDYVPRALELAREELGRCAEAAPDDEDPLAPSATPGADVPTRWWHVWLTLVAAGAAFNVILTLALHRIGALIPSIFWALLVVPFVLRLRRRGWRLAARPSERAEAPPGGARR